MSLRPFRDQSWSWPPGRGSPRACLLSLGRTAVEAFALSNLDRFSRPSLASAGHGATVPATVTEAR
jgi:hypothetical protein